MVNRWALTGTPPDIPSSHALNCAPWPEWFSLQRTLGNTLRNPLVPWREVHLAPWEWRPRTLLSMVESTGQCPPPTPSTSRRRKDLRRSRTIQDSSRFSVQRICVGILFKCRFFFYFKENKTKENKSEQNNASNTEPHNQTTGHQQWLL